jgi:ribosomal protein S18 acetylase RimI-like enzyme
MTVFSTTHTDARAAFLAACAAAGGEIASYRHPAAGPAGEPLFLDTARFGAPGARRVLFVASGTHGIEGFCGSGIQTHLVRSGLALPSGTALVLVHGVNPWGFAWLRRVNEDNVDVNRNFVPPDAALPDNPDYDRLFDALNPVHLDDGAMPAAMTALQQLEAERGPAASYRAVSGGQYRHPHGVQFGGRTPVWSNRTLRAVWARHAADADAAAFVDLHSGLGPRGTGLIFQTAAPESTAARMAQAWWPDVIRFDPARSEDAVLATGLIGPAFVEAIPAAATGVVLEFGTRPMAEVMRAVLEDNWLAHHGDRTSAQGHAIAQRMREAFLMDDPAWEATVCARAAEVVGAGLTGLASFAPAAPLAAVRPARPGDLDVLVAFSVAMARETEDYDLPVERVRAGMGALLADPARGRAFVVENGGAIAAALVLTVEWSDWRNGWFWWIQNVYVHPEHRRQGHYRRLHEHVRALASRDPEVCGLRLYVETGNDHARRTYAAMGMEETHYRLYEEGTRRHS